MDRWISALRDRDDSIISSPRDLCASLSSFYSDIFSASLVDPHIQAELLENLSSPLSGDQSSLCEGHLSMEEVLSSLRGMARPKAPGLDGLPMDFYLKFWSVMGSDLVSVLNSCLNSGCLSFLSAVVHSCSDEFWPVLCGLGGPLLSSVQSSINVNGNISPFFILLHVVILVGLVWPL